MNWFRYFLYSIGFFILALSTSVFPVFGKTLDLGQYHALLIANQNYEHWESLKTPHEDVSRLSSILKERYGFKVRVLKDANRDEIIDELERYRQQLTGRDNLLIYYAGHGKLRSDGGYWIGVDAKKKSRSRWLHYRTISELIDANNEMKARHVLVIADSCYAGALTRDEESKFAKKKMDETDQAWLARMGKTPSRTALTSGGTEPVIDHTGLAKTSIFAQELINRLKYNDDVLETDSLYGQIKKDVHARARRIVGNDAQAPEYEPIPGTGHAGGDFLFVLKGSVVHVPSHKKRVSGDFGIRGETTVYVETVPENARVRILNIKLKFVQGMELDPGSYHVEVAAKGYETERRWIDLLAGHKEAFRFELAKIRTPEPSSPQKAITNSIGMEFVLIPAGKFVMGSPRNETDRKDDEKQHEVIISKPFYLQTTELSQGQWKRVMGNNPSHFKNCGDDCPVDRVSWNDAQKFIKKLNQVEGINKYRLPTEAEWEYACRAKTETAYSFGDEVDKLVEYAWYFTTPNHPVGKKKPNDWGLYDMHGNVWEWCQDWYGDYPSNSVADPKGPNKGKYRVLRGGSWGFKARGLRSAYRNWTNPGRRNDDNGFRVARDF